MAQHSAGGHDEVFEIRIFAPSKENTEQRNIRRIIEEQASTQSIQSYVRRLEPVKVTGGGTAGRPFELLKLEDAKELYEKLHRANVFVAATSGAFVRRDPSSLPVRRKQLLSLEAFVRYKAPFQIFRTPADASRFSTPFRDLFPPIASFDITDPRVLPLHIFDQVSEWDSLETEISQKAFRDAFGGNTRRLDSGRREWSRAKALHGGDILAISGQTLPKGFHWDVCRKKGEKHLMTTHEVWEFKNSSCYCNVYPDGYVRAGQGNSSARKVWPRK
ncbi:hypothetical protein [Streptomyces sp. CA-106110]|uniref:hypothetical protein n=1 Tax=Streptomyces sp. CA-106110 TaxID=3240044 RepID=UPI003D8ACBCD